MVKLYRLLSARGCAPLSDRSPRFSLPPRVAPPPFPSFPFLDTFFQLRVRHDILRTFYCSQHQNQQWTTTTCDNMGIQQGKTGVEDSFSLFSLCFLVVCWRGGRFTGWVIIRCHLKHGNDQSFSKTSTKTPCNVRTASHSRRDDNVWRKLLQ